MLPLCLTNDTLRHEDVWGSGCVDLRVLDPLVGREWSAPRVCCFIPWVKATPLPYREWKSDLSVLQPVACYTE
jgi:hypothetical protein